MADEKWNLNTTTDLTAEPGSPVGLVNPPRSAAQHIADRPGGYGEQVVPPKPIWYIGPDGNPHSYGVTEPRKILLFWRSNVGERDADMTTNYYKGVGGLQGIGVAGHKVTVNSTGEIHHPGAETSLTLTGFWDNTDPDNPVWTQIQPSTSYTITVAAHNQAGEYGPDSDELTITTPALGYDQQHLTLPPKPPNDVDFAAALPMITSGAGGGIQLRWTRIPGVTKYEIYDNPTAATNEGMDPSRIGLNANDVKRGEVAQPGSGTVVTFTTPAYTVPRQTFALKVRAVTTDSNGTAVSAFSPPLRGHLPASTKVPGKPPAPTLTVSPIVGGSVKLTLTPPTIDASNGAPEYYAVYDGSRKVAVINAPLPAAPQVTLSYATGTAYSFTVVAGNNQGTSVPSNALTGTVPA